MDNLMAIIQDVEPANNLNRFDDVELNIKEVRKEFVGKPELCHQLVKHINYLRRSIDVVENWNRFEYLIEHFLPEILKHFDVRWLLSICDTYVDHGDEYSSAIAMNIVNIVNGTNIQSTIMYTLPEPVMLKEKMTTDVKYPTWGGMITCDIITGDTIHNMMTRNDKIIKGHRILNKIWCEIKNRGRQEHMIPVNHICQAHVNPEWRTYFK
jgi:hypothetical protein